MSETLKIRSFVSKMKSENPERRYNAIRDLYNIDPPNLDIDLMKFLLKEAAFDYPEPIDNWDNPSYILIEFLCRYNFEFVLQDIDKYFGKYSMEAKSELLNALLIQQNQKNFDKFTTLFNQYGVDLKLDIDISALLQNTKFANSFFPQSFELLENPNNRFSILFYLHEAIENGHIEIVKKEKVSAFLFNHFKEWQEKILHYDKDFNLKFAYRFWRENYIPIREELLAAVQLSKHYHNDEMVKELKKSISLKDKRIKAVVISVLLSIGEEVDLVEIKDCANTWESRTTMYNLLKEMNRLDLFPDELLNQKKIVEGTVFLELLRYEKVIICETIEILDPIIRKDKLGKELHFYPFTFTADNEEFKHNGEMIGMVGSYNPDKLPSLDFSEGVFTKFQSVDEDGIEHQINELANSLMDMKEDLSHRILATMIPKWSILSSLFVAYAILNVGKAFLKDMPEMSIIPLPFLLYFGYKLIRNIQTRKTFSVNLKMSFIEYATNEAVHRIPLAEIKSYKVENKKFRRNEGRMFHLYSGRHVVLKGSEGEELLSIPLHFIEEQILYQYLEDEEIYREI